VIISEWFNMHNIVHIKMVLIISVTEEFFFSPRHIHRTFHPIGRISDTATVQNAIGTVIRRCVQNLSESREYCCSTCFNHTFPTAQGTKLSQICQGRFWSKSCRNTPKWQYMPTPPPPTGVFGFRTNASLFLSTYLLMNMNYLIRNKLFSAEFWMGL